MIVPNRIRVQPVLDDSQDDGSKRVRVRLLPPPADISECIGAERPCRRACKLNLGISTADEMPGRRWEGRRRDQLPGRYRPELDACANDVALAQPDGLSPEATGALLGVTAERVRQLEASAAARAKRALHQKHHECGDCLDGCLVCSDIDDRWADATKRAGCK